MIDLRKAKPGDKVFFRRGSTAILDNVEPSGGLFAVTFRDDTFALFNAKGRACSDFAVFCPKGTLLGPLGRDYDMKSIHTPRRTRRSLPVSRAFNLATRLTGNDHGRHPALEFQAQNRLRGIAGRYRIPGNYTAPEYEDMTLMKVRAAAKDTSHGLNFWSFLERNPPPAFLKKSWNSLMRLNPRLQEVTFDARNGKDMFIAHYGVTSGFNVGDINFYIKQCHTRKGKPAKQARAMPVHGERLKRIEKMVASPLLWVPSPKTAGEIEARLLRHRRPSP